MLNIFSLRNQNSDAPFVEITFLAPISGNGFANLKSFISIEHTNPSNNKSISSIV